MEDRTAAGSSFYPSLLLSAHLCFLCVTRSSLLACYCRPLLFMPFLAKFVFCGVPACLLCLHHLLSPFTVERKFPVS